MDVEISFPGCTVTIHLSNVDLVFVVVLVIVLCFVFQREIRGKTFGQFLNWLCSTQFRLN